MRAWLAFGCVLALGCTQACEGTIASPRPTSVTGILPAPGPDTDAAALAPAGAPADASTSSMENRIRKSFLKLAEPTIAEFWPVRDAAGAWHSPSGQVISLVFLIKRSAPAEQDGVPTTAYVSLSERLYWAHEGGGISGIDQWYGPFPLP